MSAETSSDASGIWRETSDASGRVHPPMEAVAWRVRTSDGEGGFLIEATDVIENGLTHWKECGWTVRPLYTHPTPIKPSVDTGELRERVAELAWRFRGNERLGGPWYPSAKPTDSPAMSDCFGFADAILDLIQSERVHR